MARWLQILGLVVILLGATLLWSPRFTYTTSDRIAHTRFRVRRERVIRVPRVLAALIILTGTGVLIAGLQKK